MNNRKVLIIDDCQADLDGVKKYVNWDAFGITQIETALNGQEGYDKALSFKPDIIITDVDMPMKNGLKLAEEIRELLPESNIIFMSCFDKFDFVKQAMNLDACGYVMKPVKIEEIENLLHKIFSTLDKSLNQASLIESLRSQVNNNMTTYRKQLFFELINFPSIENLSQKLEFLKMSENSEYYFSFFKIDINEEASSTRLAENEFILRDCLLTKINDFFAKETTIINIIDEKMISILQFVDSTCLPFEQIIKTLYDFSEKVYNELDTTIKIACSNIYSGIDIIYEAYQKSLSNARSAFFYESDKVVILENQQDDSSSVDMNLNILKAEIYDIFNKADIKQIDKFLNKYFDKSTMQNEKQIRSISFSMLSIILSLLAEKNLSFDDVFEKRINVWQELTDCDTITCIRNFLFNVLDVTYGFLNDSNKSKYLKIATSITEIIDKEYSKVNSVKDITNRLYISPNYANSIFKGVMDASISHYLTTRRMNVAKGLLKDPYIKISEVSEKVGYSSPAYFRMVFKEYVGITPREYMTNYENSTKKKI